MKKIILACDLDNTLIYSYKHRIAGDSCVEWLDGREQSFMTAETQKLLPQVTAAMRLVPVTTRSLAQYQRITWPKSCPEWAVVANGGLLLHNGQPDSDWRADSLALAAAYQPALVELAARLGDDPAYAKRHMVDDVYLYTVCSDVELAEQCRADFAGFADLQVRRGGRKVYFLPPGINKGWAIERLRQIFPDSPVAAAGDSLLDLPMLEAADVALLPGAELAALLKNQVKYVCPPGEHFAEFVLSTAWRLAEKSSI